MSDDSKDNNSSEEEEPEKKQDEEKKEEDSEDEDDKHTEKERQLLALAEISGVGPRTAEKLYREGYGDLEKLENANSAVIAVSINGLSVRKAKNVIEAASEIRKAIKSGEIDLSEKKLRKRKRPEPEEPTDSHELPGTKAFEPPPERTDLTTGLEEEKEDMGIPIGPKWLTKFEKARIIGARSLQLSMGAPLLINPENVDGNLFALAEAELKSGMLPMTVRRKLPTGEHQDIPLSLLLEHTRLD
ncbi:MAG: DNA-directed RNA polymerase subunit K [Candidatus Thorarchaeota archaeon]